MITGSLAKRGNNMEELRQLLLKVSDSYSDFVRGVMLDARNNPDKIDELVKYIKDNPEADSSDIVKWTMEEIDGIDPDNPPRLILTDDDEE